MTAGQSADVVIPHYNRPEPLRRAVRSALQAGVARVIVVDDASDAALAPPRWDDPRVLVIPNAHGKGAQRARLTGLQAAQSEFVLFLDSDDELLPGAAATLAAAMQEGPERFVVTYGDVLTDRGVSRHRRLRGDASGFLLANLGLCPFSGLCVRARSVPVAELLLDLPAWQDDDFVLTAARAGAFRHVGSAVARLHRSPDAISSSKRRAHDGLQRLLERWGPAIESRHGGLRRRLWNARLLQLRWASRAQEGAAGPARALRRAGALALWVALRPFFYRIYV